MHVINKYFDNNVYVITTSVETGRQKRIIEYLNNEGIDFQLRTSVPKTFLSSYNTVDLWGKRAYTSNGNVSLCLAYLSIITECLYRNNNKLLIMEDDIEFEPNYKLKFDSFMSNLNELNLDWDVLNLGYHPSKDDGLWKFFKINDLVSELEVSWTTHMVAFNHIKTLTNLRNRLINETLLPIDYVINYFTHNCKCYGDMAVMRGYTPNEIICKQLSYRNYETSTQDKMFKSLIN